MEWWLGRVLWPFSGAWPSQTVPRSVKRLAKNRASFSEDDLCGVLAIRHGLCWGNENRGDTLIAPWRGRTRCLNAGPLASCGLTIGSRNNTRDRVAQPRLTRHRVDPIESSLKIYHMPCLGRVTLPAQMQECCVRCEAERRAIVVRSDRCTAFAWQNKRFHRVPVVASFPGICGSSPFGGLSTAASECSGLAQDHCRRHCAIIVGGIAPSLSEALRHHCRKYCTVIVGSIARSLSEVLREHCRTCCGCIAYGGDPRCLGSLCRGK